MDISASQPIGSVKMGSKANKPPVPVQSTGPARRNMNRVEKPSEEQEEISKMAAQGVAETLSREVFSSYSNSLPAIPHACPHPGKIVEAASLAAQPLPPATYPLCDSLPEELIKSGRLSALQLEGILYACQRHQVLLPSGHRAGFFIGDGAGVGKGRQIAGIILDNYIRNRRRHIWFSISGDLCLDAQRDVTDLGCYLKVISGCQQLDKETRAFGLPSDFKEGIVFSTYATLVSSVAKGSSALNSKQQTRLEQLISWCGGKDFEGCLIFDECHKAKYYTPDNEKASTKVAVAVASIQRLLPRARVVYCSATGITDVKDMAFMERLGLWGLGTPFKAFDVFLDTIQKRGLGAAEMVAMEMKNTGIYVSRGLSFCDAEFENLERDLNKEQRAIYDQSAHVWNELRSAIGFAFSRTKTPVKRMWSLFWSAHQRFFKQLCLSMKVPSIVKEAKKALQDGYAIVIGLQTTGEASLTAELGRPTTEGVILEDFISLTKEMLTRFIVNNFPTQIQTESGPADDDPWSAESKAMLLKHVKGMSLPQSPLDDLIDQLGGPSAVAEMTGRRARVVRCVSRKGQSEIRYESRETLTGVGLTSASSAVDSLNIRERKAFMDGDKKVAIISDAASTGISLHADMAVANQHRRVHLTFELAWSADKAVQQLGRSHRSNQSSAPIYRLLTTNLGGERRFAAAVAKRLQSLGALTKGDRRAASGSDLTEFNLDTAYGRSALRQMYNAICRGEICTGVSFSELDTDGDSEDSASFAAWNKSMQGCLESMGLVQNIATGGVVRDKENTDVSRFLNRILGLKVQEQNQIFSYFTACLGKAIEAAKKDGTYSEGVTDIQASSIQLACQPRHVFTEVQRPVTAITTLTVVNVDRGISWEDALKRYERKQGDHDGFYVSKREQKGKHLYLLAMQKERSPHLMFVTRPNTGTSQFEEERVDILQRYIRASPDKVESGWRKQYEHTLDRCIHSDCKLGSSCKVGCRMSRVGLLSGGIISLWSALETTMNRYIGKLELSKGEKSLRVVRVQLDDGQRLIGLRYPEDLIPMVVDYFLRDTVQNRFTGAQAATQAAAAPSQTQVISDDVSLSQLSATQLLASQPPVTVQSASQAANASGKDSAAATSSGAPQAHIEPCGAVSQFCLQRAMNPPPSIRSFFKPKTVAKCTQATSTVDPVPQDAGVQVAVKVDGEGCSSASASAPECSRTACRSVVNRAAIAADCNKDTDDCVITMSSPRQQVVSPAVLITAHKTKHSGASAAAPPKRHKQSSLSSAFGRAPSLSKKKREVASNTASSDGNSGGGGGGGGSGSGGEEARGSSSTSVMDGGGTCPVCQRTFPPQYNNTALNVHIDKCLKLQT
ncbi:uncharacterized protein LOC135808951 [Sycon ciliatum]|uniref:uncharacterized protein LOC135808951 n=1 Tax=Sycon ciliatum TaxID=27933 RepID=UPI0031F6037E